jgi:DNA-binding beta-propeller fold protein YncE
VRRRAFGIVAVMAALVSLAAVQAASAAIGDEEELRRFGSNGAGAGQLNVPRGIATDPATGHVYVTERFGNRISEFTPWGDFVKAFGWDVAPGAVNEQQEVRVRAAAGQFKLSFKGDTTGDLPFNAAAPEVETALASLPSIGAGGVRVGGNSGITSGTTPFIYVVTFEGSLAATDVSPITASDGTTPLGGGVPSPSLEARTRADGHLATAGFESCTAKSGCQAGLEGSGAGQFAGAVGAAVDAAGNLYVREVFNRRVQKFDAAGRFLLMFGGEVNKTSGEDRCTKAQLEGGDVCGAGIEGSGDGEFGEGFARGIALRASTGKLFVGDVKRIQRFNSEGEFEAAIPVPDEKTAHYLALDPLSGDFYATLGIPGGPEENVYKLDAASGAKIKTCEGEGGGQGAVATDPAGNVFAADGDRVLQFDRDCKPLSPPSCCEAAPVEGLATNVIGDLYVAHTGSEHFIGAFGPPPVSFESPPPNPPEITAQFATSVQHDGATVAAEINPHFFTDAHYYVQYGTGECSQGGCAEVPLPPGPLLTAKAVSATVRSAAIALEGLEPATTYHYRFIAQSTGGGPVYGIDPDGEGTEEASSEAGEEATFTTYPAPTAIKACPNDLLRIGPAVRLPNCRAYEMVSPVDKNNGDIIALLDVPSYRTSLSKSAAAGGRFTYTSYRSFGAPKGAPYANQYLATRDPQSGWSSEGLDPAQLTAYTPNSFENHYKAFSEDLCQSWLMVAAEPVLDPDAAPGSLELYRRENCGGGGYEALIGVAGASFPVLQGASASGKEAAFITESKLTPEAASGVWQAYYASNGGLRLICVRPNGAPSGGNCSLGTSQQASGGAQLERWTSLGHALSADGSKVYWTDSGAKEAGTGEVYLRLNPGAEQSAFLNGKAKGNGDLAGPVQATGDLASSPVVTSVKPISGGRFVVGQAVTGSGIPAATTIAAIEETAPGIFTLTLSKAATKTEAGVTVKGTASATVAGVTLDEGAFAVGQEIAAAGDQLPFATTITALEETSPGLFELTLSAKPTAGGPGIAIFGFGPCTEPEKACTLAVSQPVSPEPSRFLGASAEGSRALFEVNEGALKGDLYKFELGSGSTKIAGKTLGVAAASEDLARVYFVSEEALAAGATAKKPNLYLDEEGVKTFIATIANVDVALRAPSNATSEAIYHAARATADGQVLVFMSTESLTGYDNTDQVSGNADSEVYRYEVGAAGPVCISCSPGRARPIGRVVTTYPGALATAGWLAVPESSLYSPRVLSADGQRLFFNSFDGLLPRDTNGKGDVYEWESAPSQTACEERGAELYVAAAGGCISMISTGESPQDSEFLDASASGEDAFFTTGTSLLPRDPGLVDVYDARAGGGIAEPPPPTPACQGEACQPAVPAPNDPTPSSSSYVGPEDQRQKKAHKKKAKHKKQQHKKKGKKKRSRKQGGRR